MIMMTMAMIMMMMVMSKGIVAQLEEGSLVVQLAARCYSWGLIMLRIKMITMNLIKMIVNTMLCIKMITMFLIKMIAIMMLLIKMIIDDNIASDQDDHDADNSSDQDDRDHDASHQDDQNTEGFRTSVYTNHRSVQWNVLMCYVQYTLFSVQCVGNISPYSLLLLDWGVQYGHYVLGHVLLKPGQ